MGRFSKLFLLLIVVLAVVVIATRPEQQTEHASSEPFAVADVLRGRDAENFAQVSEPRTFRFPDDYGSHDDYRTEWWYFTGNLNDASGRRVSYQLTFFRFSPTVKTTATRSHWRGNQLYMAHLALSDIKEKQFYKFERFSRGAAGLAGAKSDGLHVWLDDWSATAESETGFPLHIKAKEKEIAIDLILEQGKPIVLHGDRGVSVKNSEPGNASYYYSYTRMPSEGSMSIDGQTYEVSGNSWMDREWSSSALGEDQIGWDWFSLQLSNNHELMFYRFRRTDNAPDQFSYGALVLPDGQVHKLSYKMVHLDVIKQWRSKHSGVSYPAKWQLTVPAYNLDLSIQPTVSDQELPLSFRYWEGSVDVQGVQNGEDIVGRGYVELTGYGEK